MTYLKTAFFTSKHELQTANLTAGTWSRDFLTFATSFHHVQNSDECQRLSSERCFSKKQTEGVFQILFLTRFWDFDYL